MTPLVTPAHAAEYTLKWAVVTRGDMQEKFGHKLAEVLPKATNGRVEVKVFPGGQLGSPAAMIEGLQLGTVEGYENPADFFTGVDPRFGEFSIPFLFRDTAQANKVLADPEFNKYVLNMARVEGHRRRQPRGRGGVALFRRQEAAAHARRLQGHQAARQRHTAPNARAWRASAPPPCRWACRK